MEEEWNVWEKEGSVQGEEVFGACEALYGLGVNGCSTESEDNSGG